MSTEQRIIPAAQRRNHWMNQIAGHAAMRPEATAFRHRGVTTTWKQAHERITAFAAALERRGVGFGDRVLMLVLNRTEVIEAVMGINTLGAMAVPINVRLAPPEIAYIVDDADADVLIVDEPLVPFVAAIRQATDRLKRVIVLGTAPEGSSGMEAFDALVAEDPGQWQAPDVPESTPALIMYTSGTTGRPKGAMLDHINMGAQAITCIRANEIFKEDDVAFMTAPLFHIAGLGSIAPNFMLGIPTVIHPLVGFDAGVLLDAYEREGATIVFNVPAQWQAICAHPDAREKGRRLRIISWGAAPASETLLRQMEETFPGALNVAVFGQTEMSPITCVLRGQDSLRKLGSVGLPIPTIQVRIVDDEMNDVPRGQVGEIIYRGPTLMQGYWRKPKETAEAFEGGWFHSGDLVRQDDEGYVWVVDRKKDMIISGGENVYCAEVENAIASHPDVLDVAVYGRPDDKWGEVPVAAVVLVAGSKLDTDALRTFLGDRLARFKQPKAMVVMDALPRNAGGKVTKHVLRARDPAVS
ncbi:fatty-acid--CoA ligase FadD5 [Paraliomyxa miuraensis]|uniref:fatty-acid--CoA ligase FadD5 n=1 Tax=Paraliomyxa miuraensis TaxID=376150 RepID=UPI002259372B|nr:fatty-acid--CoA ligase FadD5 [Paraliomyxa miuraensis]MCX4245174.1 fatty-acid--CoA ligase FadD5 [Paraliomyxa miuraensis]